MSCKPVWFTGSSQQARCRHGTDHDSMESSSELRDQPHGPGLAMLVRGRDGQRPCGLDPRISE